MKWDLYERNLLSECHVRYGGYGGIGYYHVSDTYVALFSHFIPCGVWEAVYILDGLLKNRSDIQPDTVHADTQGQSTPVFGLAYLLGIDLMPRIRNWKGMKLFRPSKTSRYKHIDSLFTDVIDWSLIETHLPDMLRVVLSIRAGRISASTLLRKLGTYSRKNRLYQAFQELGRVVRTAFLLRYLNDAELRRVIQAATNKSEAFNGFVQWLFFGGERLIAENDRDRQRKLIKYNHLVANCLIFHNVQAQTRILRQLAEEGAGVRRRDPLTAQPVSHGARQPVRQVHAESRPRQPGPGLHARLAPGPGSPPSQPRRCEGLAKPMAHFVSNRCHTRGPVTALGQDGEVAEDEVAVGCPGRWRRTTALGRGLCLAFAEHARATSSNCPSFAFCRQQ